MGICGDKGFFSAPLGEKDVAASQIEPEATVEDDYSDEEIDVDELERRIWRDKMRLKRLKEQHKCKEGIDIAKQRLSQEQARRKKMWGFSRQNKCKEGIDIAKQRRSQEQARRKKMWGFTRL
ncbi:hypothetical protein V6Z12_D08G035300 [Gossypium hirsutum]